MKRILTVLLILTFLFCSGCCGGKKAMIMPTAAETSAVQALSYSDVHAPVDAKWFDDAVLVGDSVTLKLSYYCEAHPEALGQAQFFCAGSLGYTNALWDLDRADAVHPYFKGATHLTEECAEQTGASKAFIMLGMNDIGLYCTDGAMNSCKQVVAKILEKAPDARIYLQSVTPMIESAQLETFNNTLVKEFNGKLKAYCDEKGYHYLDVYTALADDKGNLPKELCSDPDNMGLHFNDTSCKMWVDYLKKNA